MTSAANENVATHKQHKAAQKKLKDRSRQPTTLRVRGHVSMAAFRVQRAFNMQAPAATHVLLRASGRCAPQAAWRRARREAGSSKGGTASPVYIAVS